MKMTCRVWQGMLIIVLALGTTGISFTQVNKQAGAGMRGGASVVGATENDAAEIRAALQAMDDAWNRHDMEAFVSFMTDDVEWVNVVGMWWRGKEQVFHAHDAFHQTIFKTRQVYPPESVELRGIAPGVVLVTMVQQADGSTTPDGHVDPPGRSVLTEVFVHRDGRWLLIAGHNTTLVEAAQRSNPVKP